LTSATNILIKTLVKTYSVCFDYTVWVKPPPPACGLRFSDIFWQTVENFKSVFYTLIIRPIYARLQILLSYLKL